MGVATDEGYESFITFQIRCDLQFGLASSFERVLRSKFGCDGAFGRRVPNFRWGYF